MMYKLNPSCSRSRRGTVLLLSLWIIIVLVSLVLVFGRSMRVELAATGNETASIQASAIERGGEQYVLSLIEQQQGQVLTLADNYFQAVPVGDGYFWIIRPTFGDDNLPAFGLVDEASKLNLNAATQTMLTALPGMPSETPAAIVDWRDPDSTVSTGGAENEYYSTLPDPYYTKNSYLETVEETLLIKGMSPKYLCGKSASGKANLVPPWNVPTQQLATGTDKALQTGLFDYLTVYSMEPNNSATGQSRVNVNDGDRNALRRLLQNAFSSARANEILNRARPTPPFVDVFDFYFRTRLTLQEFQTIGDRLATTTQRNLMGRINVNTAPHDVLMCLPGMDEGTVTNLISRRSTSHTAGDLSWVAEALGRKSVGLGNWITTRPLQYSADIVAVSGNGRAFKRCRIVVDARTSPFKIVYRKDLTEAGFPMDASILASLRAGTGLPYSAYSQTRSVLP